MQDIIAAGIGISTGVSFALAVWIWLRTRARMPLATAPIAVLDAAILVRDGRVVDTTPDADKLLGELVYAGLSWDGLSAVLRTRFPNLPDTPPRAPLRLAAVQSPGIALLLNPTENGLHLRFAAPPGTLPRSLTGEMPDLAKTRALSRVLTTMPIPAWRTDVSHTVVWSNPAYQELCRDTGDAATNHSLFSDQIPQDQRVATLRAGVKMPDGRIRWFEITHRPDEDGMVHFANPIDQLVQAEIAQRNFVQTLTKTFAHIPIGLAVFDRDRRLVLFNPAMVDLTRLPIDFLSSRPTLFGFFDHLRERGMMPEPKSYTVWRAQLPSMIDAARDDRYCETWNLPSGLTYRITGRPHPDGAVAFLIEDISSEVTLTRRFRSETALTQSVMDRLDEAFAVFSQLGVMTACNTAFREQWDCTDQDRDTEITILEVTKSLQDACAPSDVWPAIHDFVLTQRDRTGWEDILTLKSGHRMRCLVEPVSSGATLLRFVPAPDDPAPDDLPRTAATEPAIATTDA